MTYNTIDEVHTALNRGILTWDEAMEWMEWIVKRMSGRTFICSVCRKERDKEILIARRSSPVMVDGKEASGICERCMENAD